jgi:hypothetical protein
VIKLETNVENLYTGAMKAFKDFYRGQWQAVTDVAFEELHALVYYESLKLSPAVLELVRLSFFTNNVRVVPGENIGANVLKPVSAAFILAQIPELKDFDAVKDERVKILLTALRLSSSNIVGKVASSAADAQTARYPLEVIFPSWLEMRILYTLLTRKVCQIGSDVLSVAADLFPCSRGSCRRC